MEPKQPTQGPYTVEEYDLKKEVMAVQPEDGGAMWCGKNWDLRGANGIIIASVNFSTAKYDHTGKYIRCPDLGEATANLNLLRASWLMREALKKHKELCDAEVRFLASKSDAATHRLAGKCNVLESEWLALRDAALLAAEGKVQP